MMFPKTGGGIRKQTWIAIALLMILALLLRLNVRQGRISGPSMSPTYLDGETVLVWKSFPRSKLKPGMVIIFRDTNGDELIKRIAFIGPQYARLAPDADWTTINGSRKIPLPLLFSRYYARILSGKTPAPSPDRDIYVLGDNLPESDDSRHIGPISIRQILGKVIP
ncbi:MAG: signal peptidase I [Janthinobacterium lividum]